MASYSQYLGRKVIVSYRVGDVLIPASGTLVADSGRSIFLEQHLEQRGRMNYFRWEIPYPYIHRLAEMEELQQPPITTDQETTADSQDLAESPARLPARAAAASGGSGLLPLSHRPKTA
jgi:hypothetical protein